MLNRATDEDRCSRNDGKKWRCSLPRIGGSRLCEKHHIYNLQRNSKARARASNSKREEEKGLSRGDARVRAPSTLPELKKKKMTRGRVRVSEPTIAKKEMPIGDDDLGTTVRVYNPMEKKSNVGMLRKVMKGRGVNNVRVSIVKKEKCVGDDSWVSDSNPLVEKCRKRARPSNTEKKKTAIFFSGSDPLIVMKGRSIEEDGTGAARLWVSNSSLEMKKKRGRPLSKRNEVGNKDKVSEPSIIKKEMHIEEDWNVADRVRVSNPSIETKKKCVRVSESLIMKKDMPTEEDYSATRIRLSNPSVVPKKHSRPSNAKMGRTKFVRLSDLLIEKKCGRTLKTQKDEEKKSVRNEIREEDEESLRVLKLGQIWAFSKVSEGFPRYYARIDRIVPKSTGTIALVTELVPQPISVEEITSVEQGLSLGCGLFRASQSTRGVNIFDFTHKVLNEKEENEGSLYEIFPKSGEIWAAYLKWDNVKKGFEYKLVEVVSDYSEKGGVNVLGLVRADGRDGFYRRQERHGFYLFRNCSRSLMTVFSHRVPASRIVDGGDVVWKVMFH